MSLQLLLLFTAASALCCTAIVTASGYVHNEYASNHNIAIITKQHQKHPQEAGELRLQQQKQHQVQRILSEDAAARLFEPFDFANSQGLQQINEYYDGNNNNNYNNGRAKNGQNELLQQEGHVPDNGNGLRHDDDDANTNSNGKTNNYNFYKYNEDDTDKEINSNGNPHSQKQQRSLTAPWQQQSQSHHRRSVLPPGHRQTNLPAAQETPQQDTENDIRLQLSALNDAAGTAGDNAGKGNQLASTASNSKPPNENGVPGQAGLSIVRRSPSFADDDDMAATESESDKPNSAALFNANSLDYYQINDEADSHDSDAELGMELPYGIQNTARKRDVRGAANLDHHGRSTSYQSLCLTKRLTIPLETAGYEYRPNHYIEVTCKHYFDPTPAATQNAEYNRNRVCSEVGFSCIQLNRTIHLIRRSKASNADCWESEIRIVPSGCECMWPMHEHGDIIPYHNGQKRYNPLAMAQQSPSAPPGGH